MSLKIVLFGQLSKYIQFTVTENSEQNLWQVNNSPNKSHIENTEIEHSADVDVSCC